MVARRDWLKREHKFNPTKTGARLAVGTAEGGGVTAAGGGTRGVAGEVVGGWQSRRVGGVASVSSSPFSAS